MQAKKRFLIIDANSLIHRAYHALPRLTTRKGELVNAIYGFLLVFFRALKDFRPDFVAAAFDFPAPTFRHEQFKDYKATRPKAPDDLYEQIPKVKKILENFNIQVFEEKGFEADDIIGTIARLSPKKQIVPEIENIILSGDLDTLQLVNSRTKVYTLKRGVKDTVLYDQGQIRERYGGLRPEQLLDFKALKGDPSDNIPGIPGIGEKTAILLLNDFRTLDNLYGEIDNDTAKSRKIKARTRNILKSYKNQALLSRDLARIKKDVPIDFDFKSCAFKKYDRKNVIDLFEKFEFHSLIDRLPSV